MVGGWGCGVCCGFLGVYVRCMWRGVGMCVCGWGRVLCVVFCGFYVFGCSFVLDLWLLLVIVVVEGCVGLGKRWLL